MKKTSLNRHFRTDLEPARSVRVLFSHPLVQAHDVLVPVLKEFLSHELACQVEIISKLDSVQTLRAATDHVFDLVILSSDYGTRDLPVNALCSAIKRIDKNIAVIVFGGSSQEVFSEGEVSTVDGRYPLPRKRNDLRPLTQFFRPPVRPYKN